MPFEPPKDPTERYYIVPSGIRPTLQKTRLEVHVHVTKLIMSCDLS